MPVSRSSSERAAERQRRGGQHEQRRHERLELHDQDDEHETGRDGDDREQFAEGVLLRLVLAADLDAVADRELQRSQPVLHVRDGAAEVASFEPAVTSAI